MWPFRRRKVGKHALGAAVTSIPSARPVAPVVPAAPVAAPAPGPRVELGFRDGTTAALAPGSDQAKALTEIASALTQRKAQ